MVQAASIEPLEVASKPSFAGINAPGSKNFIVNLPPDMRSMFLEKRTADVPRWGTVLPQALCSFHRMRCCASASFVNARPATVATAAMATSFNR